MMSHDSWDDSMDNKLIQCDFRMILADLRSFQVILGGYLDVVEIVGHLSGFYLSFGLI